MKLKILSFIASVIILAHGAAVKCTGVNRDPLQQGIQAFKAGDFKQAEHLFAVATRQAPSSLNFNYLAMTEWSLGNINAAIANFRQSIKLGNHSALVHYNLGIAYLKQNEMAKGIDELRQAAEINLGGARSRADFFRQ